MAELREGIRISNYILEARVGAGSFAEVWRARHHVFNELVALKIPTDAEYVRSLQREGIAIHGLRHPNIVRAIDLDPYGQPPYLVMEYVEGPSLRAAIDHFNGNFPIQAAIAITRGILAALGASHSGGLIHRDVKPANILLAHPLDQIDTVDERAVKVTDFGLGRVSGDTLRSIMQSGSQQTSEGRSIVGTIAYMSPEQKQGVDVDGRSDLYSVGIVLFEMLTGERPQGTDMPSSLRSGVGRELDDVFRRSYTRLERRFESAGEMAAALAPSIPELIKQPGGWGSEPGKALECPMCRHDILRDDQYCVQCGHQLIASVPRCPSCDGFVRPADRFCIFCGNDLRVLKA